MKQDYSSPAVANRKAHDLLIPALKIAAILLVALAIAQMPAAAQAPSGKADNGKRLFATVGCATCHGEHAEGEIGPQISPPPLPLPKFKDYVRSPAGTMRPFTTDQVSDAQLTDIYAFLEALAKQPQTGTETAGATGQASGRANSSSPASVDEASGNADNGKKLFAADGCYECHGTGAQGTSIAPRLSAPPPLPLQGLIAYVRQPTGDMPPFTGKVISDQELTDIYAFLKSIPKPTPAKDIPLLNQ